MNKAIVLHDRYDNEPIVIRPSAILAVRKEFDKTEMVEEYSEVMIGPMFISVKETIGEVMKKIKKAEGEEL